MYIGPNINKNVIMFVFAVGKTMNNAGKWKGRDLLNTAEIK